MLNIFKNRKVQIIFSLFLISIFSLVYLALQTKKTPVSVSIPPEIQTQLKIFNTYPNQAKQPMVSTKIAVSFTFNLPISIQNLVATISPQTEVNLTLSKDQKILYIQPISSWKYDTQYHLIVQGLPIKVESTFTPIHPSQIQEVFDERPVKP